MLSHVLFCLQVVATTSAAVPRPAIMKQGNIRPEVQEKKGAQQHTVLQSAAIVTVLSKCK
eukprot:2224562-Amphidinium_carterae.1